MKQNETELIAHILSGDHDTFRVIVDRYKNDLYRHCFYILHDEDTAEDMAQEAFIKAFAQLKKYSSEKASLKTWLFVIATRLCLSELRKANRSMPLFDQDQLLSTYATPEQLASDREVYEAVTHLQPRYRTVVTLHYWHGYSYEQIAEAMDVPIGSVRGWLHRAKKQLKEALS